MKRLLDHVIIMCIDVTPSAVGSRSLKNLMMISDNEQFDSDAVESPNENLMSFCGAVDLATCNG